jgi:MoaA/NifB/PqqE/SkfB family radical SAM enzyme
LYNSFEQNRYDSRFLFGCPAGIISCAISVDGIFCPCLHLPVQEVEYDSIYEFWTKSEILNQLRNNKSIEHGPCLLSDPDHFHCNCYKQEIII